MLVDLHFRCAIPGTWVAAFVDWGVGEGNPLLTNDLLHLRKEYEHSVRSVAKLVGQNIQGSVLI